LVDNNVFAEYTDLNEKTDSGSNYTTSE